MPLQNNHFFILRFRSNSKYFLSLYCAYACDQVHWSVMVPPPPCSLCVEALGHREYHFSSTVCLFVFLRCGLSLVWSMPARVDFCQQATQIHLSPSPHSRNEKYLSLCLAFKMCAMQTKLGSSFMTGKRLADWALYLSMSQPFPQNK